MNWFIATLSEVLPEECPLARTIKIGSYRFLLIPCKLNPFYEQIMTYRMNKLAKSVYVDSAARNIIN